MDTYQLRFVLLKYTTGIPVGVCASDELSLVNTNEFAIISNTDSSAGKGMHWVCFYKSKNMKCVEFFDSIGNDVLAYGDDFKSL